MKNVHFCSTALILLFIVQLFGSGCAGTSPPSRFYTLQSIVDRQETRSTHAGDHSLSVGIGPVEIPDYLNRPQILSRTSHNELTLSEFDRWAGSLKDDIARVLSQNLTLLLPENSVVVPWGMGNVSDYRVTMNIRRFEAMTDGNVLLNVQWIIIGNEGKQILRIRESLITESITTQTYYAKVSAMSGALEKLSREVAEEIKAVSRKNK